MSKNVSNLVIRFAKLRMNHDRRYFSNGELFNYVYTFRKVAPATPDRVLRKLRLDGIVEYRVVDRQRARYELTNLNV